MENDSDYECMYLLILHFEVYNQTLPSAGSDAVMYTNMITIYNPSQQVSHVCVRVASIVGLNRIGKLLYPVVVFGPVLVTLFPL